MDTQYGIAVTNKFDLFLNEDADPYDILAQQEELKKKQDSKEKVKSGKNKSAKKLAAQNENKAKVIEPPVTKKEEKPVNQSNQQSRQSERPPRSARQNRDRDSTEFRERREFREPREPRDNDSERRGPRRRDDNAQSDFRDRPEGGSGGFNRQDSGSGVSRGGFSRGRGRGGPRGRGMPRGGFGDRGERKRDFERHSGSDRTGVKAMDKREGGGAHNWGTFKDDLEEQVKDTPEETKDWSQAVEDAENQDPNESTESAEQPTETEEGVAKQMTLDEWKAMQVNQRSKTSFNIRKAGEGVDSSQWKKGIVYRKKEDADSDEEEEEEEEYEEEDEHRKKDHLNIKITFNDSPRRGRGGRRIRTGRGGRGGRGDRRGGPRESAPKFDDEVDFPSLVKTAA